MNLLHLKYAVAVEKAGSITQAAEALYMGQPNLSKAIKELEASIGITIFKRTSKGVLPTSKGQAFLNSAKSILSQIDEMEKTYAAGRANRLYFNVSVPCAGYIPLAFARFLDALKDKPALEMNFLETDAATAMDNVVQNESSIGVIRYRLCDEAYFLNLLEEKGLHYEMLARFSYVVCMAKTHPLAGCEAVLEEDLKGHIEIAHGDLHMPYAPSPDRKQAEEAGRADRRVYVNEKDSQLALLSCVPCAYSFLSPLPKETLLRYGLVQRPCSAKNQVYADGVIYGRGAKLSSTDRLFIDALKAACREVLDNR